MAYEVTTQRFTPTTGQTVTIANSPAALVTVLIEPAGTLAALTIAFPNQAYDGQRVTFKTTRQLTALTLTAGVPGATFQDTITTALINVFGTWVYGLTLNRWYKVG